jgi:transposase
VGRILKKLGMSAQRPLYRAYQQDPAKVLAWKRQTYPTIRAEAQTSGGG